MAVDSREECQTAHSIVVMTDEGGIRHPCEPGLMKGESCLNSEPNIPAHTNLKVDKANNYACILDINAEKGKAEISKSIEESATCLKSDDSLGRVFQREIWLQMGGKFTQLLMNHTTDLPKFISRDKFVAERVHDTLSSRSRKYKRSASFNSRRVVLLFSVLSSMGTIILIYLTLRVKQIADRSGNL
ncbi:uncharacterized protein LOC127242332 isoform X2 [Andrographis paniculata]|uniref:uncharacterized protein LOC127242332 isoform X2 n=1 Tax=Andrographis paniculata TaxID=175694 RepID=UPI0021E72820|nr:uncharacterized protein LOC127242332 isoform X2 [Andrographis paniculata]